ncbi:MAG: UDP-N-acetylglucosamine 2-epimerase (hydrolyzing) [Lachnospiraceae bacterium]|nr:UDP-N-acetylglucosamine 2-epimerase (hydrolyzing) [Lachnospiraceae bacterium]
MKKVIGIVTATRAEYGLLSPVIKELRKYSDEIETKVIVTGTHLVKKFGETIREIQADGVEIDEKISIMNEESQSMSEITATAMGRFGAYFARNRLDLLIVLGDRYELMGICTAAMLNKIPIAHLHGGEITEGAMDESIRHAITKLSYLHFTSTEEYRKRVIQLGEEPERVFRVGATGIENILKTSLLSKKELSESIGFSLEKPYIVATYHPVTLSESSVEQQLQNFLRVVKEHKEYQYIITKANADNGGEIINEMLEKFAEENENVLVVSSLGMKRYLSAVKYADFVAGNSSSGIIEVPSLKVPTINIGERQKGRIQAESVINCGESYEEISKAFCNAASEEAKRIAQFVRNPYGDGNTSEKIVAVIREFLRKDNIKLQKKFYDVEFEV